MSLLPPTRRMRCAKRTSTVSPAVRAHDAGEGVGLGAERRLEPRAAPLDGAPARQARGVREREPRLPHVQDEPVVGFELGGEAEAQRPGARALAHQLQGAYRVALARNGESGLRQAAVAGRRVEPQGARPRAGREARAQHVRGARVARRRVARRGAGRRLRLRPGGPGRGEQHAGAERRREAPGSRSAGARAGYAAPRRPGAPSVPGAGVRARSGCAVSGRVRAGAILPRAVVSECPRLAHYRASRELRIALDNYSYREQSSGPHSSHLEALRWR